MFNGHCTLNPHETATFKLKHANKMQWQRT